MYLHINLEWSSLVTVTVGQYQPQYRLRLDSAWTPPGLGQYITMMLRR